MTSGSTMEEEFRQFVAERWQALLRTAYLLAGDWATAEDLLQTALTKTYVAWRRLGAIEAVEPYTRRVLVNTATSWWRRRWHGERPTDVLPERAAPDRMDEGLERDALWRHVKELPTRQRAVLVLRYYEDLSEAQTAAMLGISVGTVKSQTSRAVSTLRQRLAAEGVEPALRRLPEATAPPAAGARGAAVPPGQRVPAQSPASSVAGLGPAGRSPVGRDSAGPVRRAAAGPADRSPVPSADRDVVGAYGGHAAGAGCAAGSPVRAPGRPPTPGPRPSPRVPGGAVPALGAEPGGPAAAPNAPRCGVPGLAADAPGTPPGPGPGPGPGPDGSGTPLPARRSAGRTAKR